MYLFIAALVAGFVLLMWSANQLVNSASRLGQHFNTSGYIIGFLVLGFGTSAPELLVSGLSAWQGNPGLAIGNALGSNTTNILLVLGITLCVSPLYLEKSTLHRDFIILITATVLFAGLIFDRQLEFHDGLILLIALVIILYYITRPELERHMQEKLAQGPSPKNLTILLTGLLVSLVVLLLSSKLVVWSSISIAKYLGISDLIVGLTIVAIGTSLPELATCIASALKKHSKLVLGNIIGSNIFNTLGVTGTASLIAGYAVPHEIYMRDLPVMSGAMLLVLILVFSHMKKIPRSFSILFISSYIAYIFLLYQHALQT